MNEIKRLGKYEVLSVLGKGAMGIVHKAFDPMIRRPVAIKTIRKELIDDDQGESLVERFRREAQAAGRLSHPGIVGVYEYGEEGDLAFIAMEFVEGLSLRDYFSRGVRFGEADIVSLMAQLLDALGYAHEQEVWHRDIKPANLIVTAAGRLKIADFGIARLPSSDLTQAGSVLGTPGYIAPEVYLGQDVDHRCDLFAAGAVMYQLLTGSGAFAGTAEAAMYKVCYEDPVPPSQKGESRCGPQYDALIAQALAKKPAQRFQDAKSFRAAVLSAYAQPVAASISEETIITGVKAPLPGSQGTRRADTAATRPSQNAATAPPSTVPSTALPPDWDPAVLAELERLLTPELGPIARVVVRRAARQTDDLAQLVEMLAHEVKDAAAQQTFTKTAWKRVNGAAGRKTAMTRLPTQATHAARSPTVAQTRAGTRAGTDAALTPEHVEYAVKLLAQHLGPIARAVARRAAGQTTNRTQFDRELAGSIEDAPQRARFLQALEKVQ